MPLTPNYNIFYPGSSDPWDMSANLNAMANSIDTALADVGGVKVSTTIAGLGVGDFDGQFGWLSGIDAGLRWTGTVWQAGQGQTVADTAARAILFPTPVVGDKVYRTDVGYMETFNGTSWIRVPVDGSQVSSGSVAIANGGTGATTLAQAQNNLGVEVLQVIHATASTQIQTTSASWADSSLSVSITPVSTSSKIFISVSQSSELAASAQAIGITIFRGTVASGTNLGDTSWGLGFIYTSTVTDIVLPSEVSVYDAPNTTSAVTYTVAFRTTGGAVGRFGVNGSKRTLTAWELKN